MYRTLELEIDRDTWPKPPGPPAFPKSFSAVPISATMSIPAMLLMVGLLTTPSHAAGVSLSEFWAWVRYLHAVSEGPGLMLTKAFADLDAHQKTILSDDFGMGVPMLWLVERLHLGPVCDGRYFIERMAASTNATVARASKRGPGRSPDFVAQDVHGIWHVIECKGTQSGAQYRASQLRHAITQKRTITFPRGYTGQRLACGLVIGIEERPEPSHLRITDPEGDEELVVGDDQLPFAEDAVFRGITAKGLRSAGFEAVSSAIAAPEGSSPSSRPGTGAAEDARQETVRNKKARAREELGTRTTRSTFTFKGERYRGREVRLALPAPVIVHEREIRSVRIRQGLNDRVLRELSGSPLEEAVDGADVPWREVVGVTQTHSSEFAARLQVGELFASELDLS